MSWKSAVWLFVGVAIVAALAAWGTALIVLSFRSAKTPPAATGASPSSTAPASPATK